MTEAQAPEEDVTTTLYRAAIGPVNTGYYLPIFTRFEAADHAGISWNTAASLSTLNWLAFRQLWPAALAYTGILVAVLLLVFGIGRLVFQFSDTLMMILALGFGLAAFVLPGLFGNALLHIESRKRMAKALAGNANVADACAELTRQACTRKRAIWLAGANLAFLLAAVFSYQQFSALSNLAVMPQGALEAGHVTVGRTVDMAATTSAPPMAAASIVSTPVSTPIAVTSSAPAVAVVASEPRPAASAASAPIAPATPAPTALASAPVALASSAASSAPVSPTPTTPTASAPAAAAPAPVAKASAPTTQASAAKPSPKTSTKPEATASSAARERPRKDNTKPLKAAPTEVAKKPDKTPTVEKPFFINVGLFAKPENAANAHAKLIAADLPSATKELKASKGPLTRVRVGPFASQQEAQAAVEKIKALQLDAVIVQP